MRYGLYDDTMQQQDPSTAPASPAATEKPGDDQILLNVTLESMSPMHATGDVELLTDVRAPAPGEQYKTFGGVHPVAAVGRLATPHFDVPGFRHVPGIGMGTVVVSVFELEQSGFFVGFGPGTCDVQVKTTGDIVGRGRRRDGRYYLDYLRVPVSHSASMARPLSLF